MMGWFEAVPLLIGVRDRLRRQIKLEAYYRTRIPKKEEQLIINGGLYCLAPLPPSNLRREIRALDRAIAALRGDRLDRALRGKAPRKPRLPDVEPEIELPEDPNPFRPEKRRKKP